ncbi:hypothetical protein EJ02DRAFT_132615 [Clathrospora elynae]|uniref:Uncharacterized protein n=1 Tax=Clathrospora elynae TaxID=706981 RepID=A0A6A5SUB3_9PLEO|nr:hypothetical protein EJ02DRAFT_132615 [Clathrospora elynae]
MSLTTKLAPASSLRITKTKTESSTPPTNSLTKSPAPSYPSLLSKHCTTTPPSSTSPSRASSAWLGVKNALYVVSRLQSGCE